MRIIIEVADEAELRRVTALLRADGVEVRAGGDGAPAAPAFDPEQRFRELSDGLSRFRGQLPPDYRFDRDEIHDRHG